MAFVEHRNKLYMAELQEITDFGMRFGEPDFYTQKEMVYTPVFDKEHWVSSQGPIEFKNMRDSHLIKALMSIYRNLDDSITDYRLQEIAFNLPMFQTVSKEVKHRLDTTGLPYLKTIVRNSISGGNSTRALYIMYLALGIKINYGEIFTLEPLQPYL